MTEGCGLRHSVAASLIAGAVKTIGQSVESCNVHHQAPLVSVPRSLVCFVRRCRLSGRGPPLGIAAPAGLPVGLGASEASRFAGNRRLATFLALAKLLGPLSLFLSVAPPVLHALRSPVPGLFVLPARFPRGFWVLGPGGRRSLPVTFGLRLGKFLPGAFGLLGSCAWPAGYLEGVLE